MKKASKGHRLQGQLRFALWQACQNSKCSARVERRAFGNGAPVPVNSSLLRKKVAQSQQIAYGIETVVEQDDFKVIAIGLNQNVARVRISMHKSMPKKEDLKM